MPLTFAKTDLVIPRGRKAGPVPEYIVKAVQAALKSGERQGAEGTRDEIHRAYLDVRRYRNDHPELVISVSEVHPKTGENGTSRLVIEVKKAE